MKRYCTIIILLLSATLMATGKNKKHTTAQPMQVERWGRFEANFNGPQDGNPYVDVNLWAEFTSPTADTTMTVKGFYDGQGQYKLRFMPQELGEWRYTTHSNAPTLDGKTGSFVCTAPQKDNHGMVKAKGKHFERQDGSLYFPVGTTSYGWTHMTPTVKAQALKSLRQAQFNKIRMCVPPNYYGQSLDSNALYPYHKMPSSAVGDNGQSQAQAATAKGGKHNTSGVEFDKTRFNPDFFHRLESDIDSLCAMGCEADLILFHPYDKGVWGLDQMTMDENLRYLEYLEARISSFRNVWWSMANEYDYCTAKSFDDWVELIKAVRNNDPYGHLHSIHGSTATYFPYEKYKLTHTSIQDEAPVMEQGRASIVRNIYNIPVVFDEVRYEGNLKRRWGHMSGEEMVYAMWCGLAQGTYVTHGESIQYAPDDYATIFWGQAGIWRGEAWKRIPFMRKVLADLPAPLQMADVSRDEMTATAGDGYYLVYLGKRIQDAWTFSLPQKNATFAKLKAGQRFNVEIIDTWNMTVTPVGETFETSEPNDYRVYDKAWRKIRLPLRPYLMLRIKKAP